MLATVATCSGTGDTLDELAARQLTPMDRFVACFNLSWHYFSHLLIVIPGLKLAFLIDAWTLFYIAATTGLRSGEVRVAGAGYG
jgi:hypothetical protein